MQFAVRTARENYLTSVWNKQQANLSNPRAENAFVSGRYFRLKGRKKGQQRRQLQHPLQRISHKCVGSRYPSLPPLSLRTLPSATWQSILISTAISINKWQIAWRMGKQNQCIYDERRSKMDLNPVPSDSHDSCRVPRRGHPILPNLCGNVSSITRCLAQVCVRCVSCDSCIFYLAPCLWREWMNNFRLSDSESSLRIKSRARKVCSVNHRARPLLSYLTKVGVGGGGGRRDLLLLLLLVAQA